MTNGTQVVVDIETRATTDYALITRIAVTPFNFIHDANITFKELVDRTLYLAFDQQEQLDLGRITDADTEAWWATQPHELQVESIYPTEHDMKAAEVLLECKRFLKQWNYNHFKSFLWARNYSFESGKLQTLSNTVFPGEKHIFNYWNWHECKTFNHILTGGETTKYVPENIDELGFQYHNAKHDAAMDAYRMILLWNQD